MEAEMDGEAEEVAPQEVAKPIKLVTVEKAGGIDHIYANNIVVGVTGYDVTLWFSKLVRLPQHEPTAEPVNQLEHRATVTLAWAEAKALRNVLTETLEKLEKLNGEINPAPKIA
jgi:hypothetical protein